VRFLFVYSVGGRYCPRTEVGGPKAAKEAANRRRTVARSDAFGRPMRANGTFSKRNPPAAGTVPAVGRRGCVAAARH
jgi:hypothetical protein